ncbi:MULTISPECIES: flagellar biosynthesis protein FlhB [Methylobacterium]|jgi:flagellar biosynthetic protein FlhB|uniref:Flagellar biosynthetic protein FlhB n=2 Tax=Methylobacterium TaxID=407 RepID=A0A089NVM9_9HYPH|nr:MULTISPECIES: flagellar biosynthesis protein FlhB [Methylobacterium]AIQ89868.1 flagellar biosynthesis protein FlhB [Methylobacterium oryzae CBMB20]AWV17905.1 flagellar biosynthesis protein FlhB [Methylobacterium sp. XJLW]MBA9063348.1 flagellar biosynthetic protein FlhB [Methylobacterium fujisawaense]MDH3027849.1 flagellar biosynthesis protein FlhB [Methylobacterium fujisawaense]SFU30743.1 flagellar biosynthetic protein FlhB [Methylobacterium sp. UNCCL125]
MSDDKESKTEAASEKKISDAVAQGNTPFSREAPVFASIMGLLVFLVFVVRDQGAAFVRRLTLLLEQPRNFSVETSPDAKRLVHALALEMGRFLLPVLVILLVAGIAASIFQNAPRIVFDRIQPQWSRISPASGWKRIFSTQGFVEFGKSLFKFLAIGGMSFMVLRADRYEIVDAMFVDPIGLPEFLLTLSVRLISAVSVATIALVAGDLVWSRLRWQRDLRMSRQELKDEFKQLEGDPLVKARLRSLAQDRLRKQMMAAVPRATMILANPTHYAIALRYDQSESDAPVVLAKGADLIALRIREIAERNRIEVVVDKALTRAMYDHVEINQAIPAEFYRAVANLLVYVMTRKRR